VLFLYLFLCLGLAVARDTNVFAASLFAIGNGEEDTRRVWTILAEGFVATEKTFAFELDNLPF